MYMKTSEYTPTLLGSQVKMSVQRRLCCSYRLYEYIPKSDERDLDILQELPDHGLLCLLLEYQILN